MSAEQHKACVLKFGGSATVAEQIGANSHYFDRVLPCLAPTLLSEFSKLVFVIGGGKRARLKQRQFEFAHAAKGFSATVMNQLKDEVGVATTREHAYQLAQMATRHHLPMLTIVASSEAELKEFLQIAEFGLALGGLKIGQSTDAVALTAAVFLQQRGYETDIVILSNIACMFTEDPKQNPHAKPIREAHIHDLIQAGIVTDQPELFHPGMNCVLDPVAVSLFEIMPILPTLYFTQANRLRDIYKFLTNQQPQTGTLITPDSSGFIYYNP